MEKYNRFIQLSDELADTLSAMQKAEQRQEVDELEIKAKSVIQRLRLILPSVSSSIHDFATSERIRISKNDFDRILEK